MKFIAIKTEDGRITGKISFYCRALDVTRQAFYDYLYRKNMPCKYEPLAEEMMKIHDKDECNDIYGRERMLEISEHTPEIICPKIGMTKRQAPDLPEKRY